MKKKIEKIPDDKKYYEESEFVEEVIEKEGGTNIVSPPIDTAHCAKSLAAKIQCSLQYLRAILMAEEYSGATITRIGVRSAWVRR